MTDPTTPEATSAAASAVAATPPTENGQPRKLHGRAFYESIGSPKYVVAPMVDQSEFAWRLLTRSFLAPEQRKSVLAYSPMLHARLFVDSPRYRASHFEAIKGVDIGEVPKDATGDDIKPFLDGNPAIDRPLFVQFCANDPDALLGAAKRVAPYCDAVDLNLGCPQGIARKGHYGAFLQEEPELIVKLIRTLHENLDVPVTAKIRILDTPEASLMYAKKVLAAGASILTIHGRRRDQKGHMTGIANWKMLKYLRDNLPPETVLFANGNILQQKDVDRCLEATGFDGVMSAEGLLSDPALFVAPPTEEEQAAEAPVTNPADAECYWHTPDPRREYWRSARNSKRGGWRIDAVMRRYLDILHVYCLGKTTPPTRRPLFIAGDSTEWLKEEDAPLVPQQQDGEPARKKRKRDDNSKSKNADKNGASAAPSIPKETLSSPNFVSVQGHLFHLLRHAVAKHHDIRDALARSRKGDIEAYERILAVLEKRIAHALAAGEDEEVVEGEQEWDEDNDEIADDADSSAAAVRRCKRPWWVVQPILRPMPAEALAKGAIQLKKKVVEELEKEKEQATEAAVEEKKAELTTA
ncbi:dihydrouridine synthase family [Ophiostoma piceae UAMH 11346]|uniref:tRNA-dihydrouridine(16/17) synthase [NAD(P)(+)] n=1 Tax=Ophiostoma piceae (strain UAMH 11346) TaxID=1262450 RepID=S3C9U9_OPHP1|nr:dihydrouridine synthase family [Ophiostoma piceae UAMH 11346]